MSSTGLPNTPKRIREFIGPNFSSLKFGLENEHPHEDDTYTLTAHDLISAFQWFELENCEGQPAATCVACEEEPSPENTPCAVCGAGQPAASAEPVAWFIDWPDEPDLGHCLAEAPVDGARCRALVFHDAAPVAAQAQPYSLSLDPAGIRALAADAITGALAMGAQGAEHPPDGHWLKPFFEMGRQATAQVQPLPDSLVPTAPDLEYLRSMADSTNLPAFLRGQIAAAVKALADQARQDADMVSCGCGDLYPSNSYGAGFIAAAGHCENCNAAQDCHPEAIRALLAERDALRDALAGVLVDDLLPLLPAEYIAKVLAALAQQDADPLQGAAEWLLKAVHDCEARDLQHRLLIGHNRATRLIDAARKEAGE